MDSSVTPSERAVIRKIFLRIVPFSTLLLLFSQIDKHDFSFAALTMNRDLGLTATMYGLASSAFYVGYLLCEIPSNMILRKVGARFWLARLSVTLGIISAATLIAVGPISLVAVRFVLGMAEAGIVPGLLLYFTFWFPPSYRSRANGWFLIAMPVASVIASILSGAILELNDAFGLAGWQWLFLLLGVPPVILGIMAFLYLTDGPEKTRWLSQPEKTVLAEVLAKELGAQNSARRNSSGAQMRPWGGAAAGVALLCVANFCIFVVLSILTTWTPQIMHAAFPGNNYLLLGWIAATPALAAAIGIPIWSAHADAARELKWHVILPMLLAAAGLAMAAYLPLPLFQFAGMVLCSAGAYGCYGIFWSLAAAIIPASRRAVLIAAIHAAGTLGAIVSPVMVGFLKDRAGDFSASLLFGIGVTLCGAIAVGLTKSNPEVAAGERNAKGVAPMSQSAGD